MNDAAVVASLRGKLGISNANEIVDSEASLRETPASLREKLLGPEYGATGKHEGMSYARIEAIIPELTKSFSFYRWYPDIYLDSIQTPDQNFRLTPYQRIFLRVSFRYRYVSATFPRGYSKSLLAVLSKYLQCIFYPNKKAFVVSPGKQQSVSIVQEKLEEIWSIWPALKKEIIEDDTKIQRDVLRIKFKNGSYLDVLACNEHSRGQRRTDGVIEEAAKIDGNILSGVIIPTMNISRRAANGKEDPNDITNKSQLYITSAGDRDTFAYSKLCHILIWSALRPNESFCFGGTWRTPVAWGLLNRNFVEELKRDGTYSDETFATEFESIWSGSSSDAFFNGDAFDECRKIQLPMTARPMGQMARGAKFILSYDVGRNSDQSSCVVIYAVPSTNGTFIKNIVNIYAFDKMHFEEQAKRIKRLFLSFGADKLVIDANGPGIGLVDFLTVVTNDRQTGETLPALGVDHESDTKGMYKNYYHVPDNNFSEKIWLVRATDALNSEMHNLVSAQIATQKIQFLIDEQLAKEHWSRKMCWKTYTTEQKISALQPYVMTRLLKSEMMNLRKKTDDSNSLTLKKISSKLKKDKFSALEYGVFYVKRLENRRNVNYSTPDLQLTTPAINHSYDRGGIGEGRKGGLGRGNSKFRRT